MEKMEEIQFIGSSSPYESNQASPTRGRRPLPFKRDLMCLSLSLSSLGNDLIGDELVVRCLSAGDVYSEP
jgi:hypothetical protein